MRRTKPLRIALSALLVAGVSAGFAPVPAGAATPADEKAPASGSMLAAMQRDFGLTKSQAEARLSAEKKATAVEGKARRAAGSSYGGAWFTPESGRLTVAVTDPDKAAAVRSTGAEAKLVKYSAKQLDAAKERIDALEAPKGVASWHVDPASNRIVVETLAGRQGDNDVRHFLAQAREAGPVTVEKTAHAPRTLAAGDGRRGPLLHGQRPLLDRLLGERRVRHPCGHCSGAGAAVNGWDGSYIGNFQGSSFPDNDYAWVNVGSGWWTVPVVLGWGTVPDQLVRGSAEAPIGASICRSGSTSHWHCGNVLAKNETVNYSQGAVHEMTKTNVCAEPGDSGGSFISGDQAQGVTSGGWGDCSGGGETWYQPINEILNRYGLTLTTA